MKLSTGPRTDEGKARSSQNAITHGLTALILPHESEEEFLQMNDTIIKELKSKGQLELELATRIASIVWRLRRIPIFETLLIAGLTVETFFESDLSGKIGRYETALQRQLSSLLRALRDMQARRDAIESKCERTRTGLKIVSTDLHGSPGNA